MRLALALLIPLLLGAAEVPAKPVGLNAKLEALKFRCIGPYRGGRAVAGTGVPRQPLTYYFGATGGGVWKTTDGGISWSALGEREFSTGSVGSIAVAESDPNVVYVGTGESPIRANASRGDGIYRSTDAGKSWSHLGLEATRQISRVRVHPRNPDLVYVAALGRISGPNPERGIYRSGDGGKTWKRILFVDGQTGASDLAMDPTNPRILYAAFWQVVRKPWELVSGGPGSGLYRSEDGGDSWTRLGEGLPAGTLGRIGVAASAAKPGLVFALIEHAKLGGLYRSDDGGGKWVHINDEHKLRQRPWYYSWLTLDPKNPDVLWIPNIMLHKSIDGGRSFAAVPVAHGDCHDAWIDPEDSQRMIMVDDGGATITTNGGRTWSTQNNQPTAQFYRVATDDRFPYWVYGSQQDNSSVGIPSAVPGRGIGPSDWHPVGGGESGWIAPKISDPEVVFAGEYGGQLTRYDHRTRQTRAIMPWPELQDGREAKQFRYRWNWNAPVLLSRHDGKTLYHASNVLLRSRDEGATWEEASPDLTRNDKAKQGKSGGPVTTDVTGAEAYCTIFALAESPLEPGLLWVGSDDGLLHLTRDDGKTWELVTPKGLPEWSQINALEASPHAKGAAYLAATRYKLDDDRPYIFRTRDHGKSWTSAVKGLPPDAFVRVVREDPARRGLLYAGTESGLFVSFDDGENWESLRLNLPAVPITDLQVKGSDLVVATQGRAFWILDDLTALRSWTPAVAASEAHLFAPRPTVRQQIEKPDEEMDGLFHDTGANPPEGAVIDFWLKEKPATAVLEFRSGDTLLRRFTTRKPENEGDLKAHLERVEREKEFLDKPMELKAGLNRVGWDLRILRPSLVPKAVFNEGERNPPKVAPGTYSVQLKVGGSVQKRDFEVKPHPGVMVAAEDLRAQFALLKNIRDQLSALHLTVLKSRDVRSQAKEAGERAVRLGKGGAIGAAAKALEGRLLSIEDLLTNPEIKAEEDDLNYEPKLDHDFVFLAGVVASADAAPTKSSAAYYALLKGKAEEAIQAYEKVAGAELKAFNELLLREGMPTILVAPRVDSELP